MPKRFFSGEKAWNSDKIRDIRTDEFRAEFAWIHSLSLCDGTFECEPQKVWATCYAPARDIEVWTVKRVGKMLDEFDRAKLLERAKDREGKLWGYWTGGDDCLPPRTTWHKFSRGKRHLFTEEKIDAAPATVTVGDVLDLVSSESAPETIESGIKKGEPGYYRKGQYPGTDPKRIHNTHIAQAWQRVKGQAAVAVYPSKWPEKWESVCDQCSADLIVPAFELWAAAEGSHMDTRCPAGEFAKVAQDWTQRIIPLNAARPKLSQETIKRTEEFGLEAWEKTHPGWKRINGELVNVDAQQEPGPDDLFGPETKSEDSVEEQRTGTAQKES